MQIFLLKDLPGKGKAGEVINVNDGYGRNFIIKNGIGRAADNATLSHVKAKKESDNFRKQEDIALTKESIKELEALKVTISCKVGANGKMFGAITSTEVAGELSKLGFNIDKKNLVFENIKDPGVYRIKAKFNHGLSGEFILEVIGNAN